MTESNDRILSWQHFDEDVVSTRGKARILIEGSPEAYLVLDENPKAIGIDIVAETSSTVPVLALKNIAAKKIHHGGKTWFRISTENTAAFETFYHFIALIADNFQVHGMDPGAAVEDARVRWISLTSTLGNLTEEERVGLVGELLVLRRLIRSMGDAAVLSWVGPKREPHDFRFDGIELEVKTTRRHDRVHFIHNLQQLTETPGNQLNLFSIQIQPAGQSEGFTLNSLVEDCRKGIQAADPLRSFEEKLLESRYDKNSCVSPAEAYALRTAATLVPILQCPRLTESTVSGVLDISRLHELTYRISVEGLGHREGSSDFLAIAPQLAGGL